MGALKEFLEPTIIVRENAALAFAQLKVSTSPVGFVAKFSVVVFGSRRTVRGIRTRDASNSFFDAVDFHLVVVC